jgi:hypothetical protein
MSKNPLPPVNVSGLTTCEQERLKDISCDCSLKDACDADKLPQFWLLANNDFPSLSDKAINVLFPFVTTFLCETCFSLVAAMETKYRLRLIIEKELQVTISSATV